MKNPFKQPLSFSQIINMNVGFLGIQYSFGLQQSAVTPIYDMLGANPDQIPMLHLAGPVTGLLVQPIIGALSDRTWSPKWGRRKPYFLIGAIICSLCLLVFPYSSSLWMAAGLLWILDAGNNTAMEPYRAFVADKLDEKQQPLGFQAQSFFTGFGQTLANISLYFFPLWIIGKSANGLPNWMYASFFLGSACSIGSILWSMYTTPEDEPSPVELAHIQKEGFSFWAPFKDIPTAIANMPKTMWQLSLVYLFQWYALFCFWQNNAKSIALNLFNATPQTNADLYEKAVGLNGLISGWYNIVTFMVAFGLAYLANTIGAKKVHFIALILAGLGLIFFANNSNQTLYFVAITGFGIGWASMMGIPYLLVVNSIPKEKYGVYMGIINMMIVIPMIIQNLTFGYIQRTFLNNNPSSSIMVAGVLLLVAAAFTLLIDSPKVKSNE